MVGSFEYVYSIGICFRERGLDTILIWGKTKCGWRWIAKHGDDANIHKTRRLLLERWILVSKASFFSFTNSNLTSFDGSKGVSKAVEGICRVILRKVRGTCGIGSQQV